MGLRRNTLVLIKELLNNKQVALSGRYDTDTIGSGQVLHVYNKVIDVDKLITNPNNLPILSVIPAPHTIEVGLNGNMMDSNYRVSIFGFVISQELEELALVGEDTIEFIVQTLTDWDNIEAMRLKRFSVVEFGPVLNEFYSDDPCGIGYISIPLTIQFVEN